MTAEMVDPVRREEQLAADFKRLQQTLGHTLRALHACQEQTRRLEEELEWREDQRKG